MIRLSVKHNSNLLEMANGRQARFEASNAFVLAVLGCQSGHRYRLSTYRLSKSRRYLFVSSSLVGSGSEAAESYRPLRAEAGDVEVGRTPAHCEESGTKAVPWSIPNDQVMGRTLTKCWGSGPRASGTAHRKASGGVVGCLNRSACGGVQHQKWPKQAWVGRKADDVAVRAVWADMRTSTVVTASDGQTAASQHGATGQ